MSRLRRNTELSLSVDKRREVTGRSRSGTDGARMKLFRSAGSDPVKTTKKFMTVVSKGDLTSIRKYLGKKEVPLATVDKLGRNALHIAALHSQERSVRLLIELGVDPVHCDDQRWTPLHTACSVGHCDIAELFLSIYASRSVLYKLINQEDLIECRPLHLACISGNPSLVRALVKNKADISLKDGNGRTPLEICISKQDPQLVNALSESLEEQSKKTMKHSAGLSVAIREDKLEEVVKALLSGLNINTKTRDEQSLLFIAACAGSFDITRMLIGRGADINIRNSFGRTILHQLTLEGYKEMFDLFIELPDIDATSTDDLGKTVLHTAAEWGRVRFLDSLVEQGADVEAKDGNGCTPLHVCAQYGKKAFVLSLLTQFNANPNARDANLRTPLHYAAKWKRVRCMQYLLENGADVNVVDSKGKTPLHLCCTLLKYPPAVQLLLEMKADVTIQDKEGNTALIVLTKWIRPKELHESEGVLLVELAGLYVEKPLYSADYKAHYEIANALITRMIEQENSLDITDEMGRTALHWAVMNRHKDIAVALIAAGADSTIKDKNGNTPFIVCEEALYPSNIRQGLLKAIEARNKVLNEKTPEELAEKLFVLASANNTEEIIEMIEKENKLEETLHNIVNERGQTLLHITALCGALEACLWIIKHPTFSYLSLHKKDSQGNTPLHLAATEGHEMICETLVKTGSDVLIKNKAGKTATECSSSNSIIEHLSSIEKSLRSKKLFVALDDNEEDEAKALIQKGVDLTAVDEYGCSPLIVACINNLVDVAALLIEKGSSVDEIDENYQTPLHWAAIKGNIESIQLLLDHNASLHSFDVLEQTPLHWAVLKEQQEAAILLVKSGADVHIANADGQTPIDCASEEMVTLLQTLSLTKSTGPRDPAECTAELFQMLGQKDPLLVRAKELLEEGADIKAVDEHGSTLICAAAISGSYDITKLFITRGCEVSVPDENGQTPLHWASIKGHCSVGQLLIDAKADPNCSDTEYRTPLHWAVLQGHTEFVRVLMRSGADVTLKDEEGQSPMDLAVGRVLDTLNEFLKTPRRSSVPSVLVTEEHSGPEFNLDFEEPVDTDSKTEEDNQNEDEGKGSNSNEESNNDEESSNEGNDMLEQTNGDLDGDCTCDSNDSRKDLEESVEQVEVTSENEMASGVAEAMKETMGELIRNAVQSARITDQCVDTEKAEQLITATVDAIISRVQIQAEELVERTIEHLASLDSE